MTHAAELPLEVDCHAVHSAQRSAEDFLFLDCREQDEYETARIAGTKLLPMSQMQDRIAELDGEQERRIVVHCHHGGRSLRVAKWLRTQGISKAQSLACGIDMWSLQIDPNVPRY